MRKLGNGWEGGSIAKIPGPAQPERWKHRIYVHFVFCNPRPLDYHIMPDLLPIYRLIYRSQASRAVHEMTLVPLLRKARQYNQQANLGGLLVHTNG